MLQTIELCYNILTKSTRVLRLPIERVVRRLHESNRRSKHVYIGFYTFAEIVISVQTIATTILLYYCYYSSAIQQITQ